MTLWLSNDQVDRLRDVATRPELPPGRYTLLRPIGRGGMGSVYAARDEQLGREVAIKVSNATAPDNAFDRRLREESRVLASLEHPGIVPVHDAGTLEDGRVFYVMKLVQGETLSAHAGTLTTEASRLVMFERIAETVAFAHSAGVVHRDLKPSNVMVGRFGEVLVLDWGVAKRVDAQDSGASGSSPSRTSATGTESGTRIGTSGFMAPEQARGEAALAGPPADVFALGSLLCWLFTGEPAPADAAAVRHRLSAVRPKLPRRLRAIIERSLAPQPADRYPHAAALTEDLRLYRDGQPVSAHRDTFFERAQHWTARYQAFILLVVAYLIMRALFAVLKARP